MSDLQRRLGGLEAGLLTAEQRQRQAEASLEEASRREGRQLAEERVLRAEVAALDGKLEASEAQGTGYRVQLEASEAALAEAHEQV